MRDQQSSIESNSDSTAPQWSVACHICNRVSRDGNDGLLAHYIDEHPRSAVARRGSLLDPRNYARIV